MRKICHVDEKQYFKNNSNWFDRLRDITENEHSSGIWNDLRNIPLKFIYNSNTHPFESQVLNLKYKINLTPSLKQNQFSEISTLSLSSNHVPNINVSSFAKSQGWIKQINRILPHPYFLVSTHNFVYLHFLSESCSFLI